VSNIPQLVRVHAVIMKAMMKSIHGKADLSWGLILGSPSIIKIPSLLRLSVDDVHTPLSEDIAKSAGTRDMLVESSRPLCVEDVLYSQWLAALRRICLPQ
jgi:hypothetical protein